MPVGGCALRMGSRAAVGQMQDFALSLWCCVWPVRARRQKREGGQAEPMGGLQWAPRPSGLPLSLHCWLKVRGREGPMSGKPWAPSLGLVCQGSTPWLSECRRRPVGTACETCR